MHTVIRVDQISETPIRPGTPGSANSAWVTLVCGLARNRGALANAADGFPSWENHGRPGPHRSETRSRPLSATQTPLTRGRIPTGQEAIQLGTVPPSQESQITICFETPVLAIT